MPLPVVEVFAAPLVGGLCAEPLLSQAANATGGQMLLPGIISMFEPATNA